MARNLSNSSVVIASGATTSAALTMDNDRQPIAIITPAAMTGTALTFEASDDNGTTWRPLFNESTAYSITISTSVSRHYALARQPFEGVRLVRIVSNGTEGAARTLKIISGQI